MEKLLVTQALDERDLLRKRIVDAISKSKLVAVRKSSSNKTDTGVSIEDFEAEAKSSMQRIFDLIDRYERLDSAILLANATEKITVAGKEMSRASAINLRKSLLGICNTSSTTDFRGLLISSMSNSLNTAKSLIQKSQIFADKQKEVMLGNITSTADKALTNDALQGIDTYCEKLVDVLVDPINIEKKLAELNAERDEFISNLESAIKVSNATTFVEF